MEKLYGIWLVKGEERGDWPKSNKKWEKEKRVSGSQKSDASHSKYFYVFISLYKFSHLCISYSSDNIK